MWRLIEVTGMLDRMQLEPAHLFYSYASEDEALREILEKHLKLLERQGLLASWHHRLIGVDPILGGT
jgi:hypothetical protein